MLKHQQVQVGQSRKILVSLKASRRSFDPLEIKLQPTLPSILHLSVSIAFRKQHV